MSEDSGRLLALIANQDRVISRGQALHGGLSRHAVAHRLRPGGAWRHLLPGVYLTVTGTPTTAQREIAAVLYAGPQSAITGTAALRYHRLTSPRSDVVDILVPAHVQRRSVSYLRLHRTARMPQLVFRAQGRAYVGPARAAADGALWLSDLQEARAVIAGAVQDRQGCTVDGLVSELKSGPIRNSALLRMVLAEVRDGIRSAPEGDLRALIVKTGLPMPMFNPRLYLPSGTFLGCPDAWWPEAGLVAEVDSKRWHLSPGDWELTMERHARFGQQAVVTLHFTPHQLRTDGPAVAAKIRNAYHAGIARPRLPITALPVSPGDPVVVTTSR